MQNTFLIILLTVFLFVGITNGENIEKAMDLYMQGELSLLSENIDSAEKYFQEALSFSPDNPTILLSLLEISINKNDFNNIENILKKYLDKNQLNINVSIQIIDLYKKSSNSNLFNIFDLLIDNNPQNMQLRYEKAQILILMEEWHELLSLYSEMYIIEPSHDLFETLLNIGLSIEDPQILYNSLEYIWTHNKTNIEVLELLIQFSYLSEDQSITKKYLEDLLGYDPQNEFAIMMLSEINILNQDFFRVIKLLEEFKSDNKLSFDGYRMLLISYSNIEDYKREFDLSSEIMEKFPFESFGYESLAISYLESGDYIEAIEILNKAIKVFPEEYYFYYYLGLCYRNSSKNNEAISYFLKALKINPELKNVMHELAKLYNLESNYESSDSLFTLLLEKNVNDAIIMNDYAYLISERQDATLQRLNFALELSHNVISIVPDSPEYLDTIGWIYYKIGKYEKALDYLLKSQSMDKQNSIILEHLGDVYFKLEKYEKALNIYNQIIINDPGDMVLKKKIKLLNEK